MPDSRKKILFICVGNSCRSQMAEGFARQLGDGRVEARSAGTAASGIVNPAVVEAMDEAGVEMEGHTSEQLTEDMIEWADVVVTLGSISARFLCPPSFKGEQYDWDIEDPIGKPREKMREVRDDIREKVRELIDEQE